MESCAVCRDEVAAYALVVDALPLAAPQQAAPWALRRRVLREARAQPPPHAAPTRPARAWSGLAGAQRPALAAFAVVLAVLALVGGVELGKGGDSTQVIKASIGSAELQVSGGHGQLIVVEAAASGTGAHLTSSGCSTAAQRRRRARSSASTRTAPRTSAYRATCMESATSWSPTSRPAGSASPTGKPLIVAALS